MQLGIRFHDTAELPFEERIDEIRRQGFSCTHIALSKVIDLPGGGGKIPVTADYFLRREGNSIFCRNYCGEEYCYPDID